VFITRVRLFCEETTMPDMTAIRSTYSWTQAVRDGRLIDVTETALGTGFNYPVAVTQAAWGRCVQPPEGAEGQDEARRLSNVLDPLIGRIQSIAGPGDSLHYQVRVRAGDREPRPVALKAVVAFDDDGWPCLRVSLPEED
jgi:hypothetical protein